MFKLLACLAIALGCLPAASQAQFGPRPWRPHPWQPVPSAELEYQGTAPEEPSHNSPLLLAAGGLAGYAALRSLFAVTEHLAKGEGDCAAFCLSRVSVVASALAAPTLVPLGVHLANGRRGDLGADVLSATAVSLGVLLIGARAGMSADELMVAVPVGQILAAVASEIVVSRGRREVPEP